MEGLCQGQEQGDQGFCLSETLRSALRTQSLIQVPLTQQDCFGFLPIVAFFKEASALLWLESVGTVWHFFCVGFAF